MMVMIAYVRAREGYSVHVERVDGGVIGSMIALHEDAQRVNLLEGHLIQHQLDGLLGIHGELLAWFGGFTGLKIQVRLVGVHLDHAGCIVVMSAIELGMSVGIVLVCSATSRWT